MNLNKIMLGTLLSLSLVGLFSACAPQEKKSTSATNDKEKTTKVVKMTLGAMAAPDSAPLFVAQEQGFFRDEGIDANIELFRDAIKQDATMVPEPFLTMARGQGLHVFGVSNPDDFRVAAMAFDKEISQNKQLMSKFYRAYNRAVTLLYC
ncbi:MULTISPECIES: ABC transporter substrate-binding protein [Amylolactobacillus]|nr:MULTISPECIES: ABC transporter substrate-binding protein [Amylolactobacillus]GED80332.1 hypothetical protein LAM01_08050 [Amylolactobacillus amylophilus]